jgi:KUP system potassium uptake protein
VRHPGVLAAADPRHAIGFLTQGGAGRFAVLGAVFLAITGGEALYADMGHIGKTPIRMAWYCVVLAALLLSYAGQTALLLDDPSPAGNPFFKLAPTWTVYPLVALATVATVVASQAIITGSFSLTRQAMQLGWFPGVQIRQTSAETYGQIYVPFVNWAMMLFTIALTIGFGSSDRLAGAYGTAVSTTMLLTTALLYKVMRNRWGWSLLPAAAVIGGFLIGACVGSLQSSPGQLRRDQPPGRLARRSGLLFSGEHGQAERAQPCGPLADRLLLSLVFLHGQSPLPRLLLLPGVGV